MKKKIKNKLGRAKSISEKWLKQERVRKKFNLLALFVLGFLIGIMLKSQALENIVSGFDDYKAMKSDEVETEDPMAL